MPRPRNKEDLVKAASTNYEKFLTLIENRTENEKKICYDFSGDEKKNLTIDELLEKFTASSGKQFDNDRALLSR